MVFPESLALFLWEFLLYSFWVLFPGAHYYPFPIYHTSPSLFSLLAFHTHYYLSSLTSTKPTFLTQLSSISNQTPSFLSNPMENGISNHQLSEIISKTERFSFADNRLELSSNQELPKSIVHTLIGKSIHHEASIAVQSKRLLPRRGILRDRLR